jgi:hypothetical protein
MRNCGNKNPVVVIDSWRFTGYFDSTVNDFSRRHAPTLFER